MAFALPSKYVERARAVPAQTWLIIAGAAAVGLYLIFRYQPTPQQKAYLTGARNRLDELARDYGIVPSLSVENFSGMAAQILNAIDKCGTNESELYDVFRALNNEADLMMLILAFDIAKYDGCFEGRYLSIVHYTLAEALSSDLDSYERGQVNAILAGKGIIYRF